MTLINDLLTLREPLTAGPGIGLPHYWTFQEGAKPAFDRLKELEGKFTDRDIYKKLGCEETGLKLHWTQAGLPLVLPHSTESNKLTSFTAAYLTINDLKLIKECLPEKRGEQMYLLKSRLPTEKGLLDKKTGYVLKDGGELGSDTCFAYDDRLTNQSKLVRSAQDSDHYHHTVTFSVLHAVDQEGKIHRARISYSLKFGDGKGDTAGLFEVGLSYDYKTKKEVPCIWKTSFKRLGSDEEGRENIISSYLFNDSGALNDYELNAIGKQFGGKAYPITRELLENIIKGMGSGGTIEVGEIAALSEIKGITPEKRDLDFEASLTNLFEIMNGVEERKTGMLETKIILPTKKMRQLSGLDYLVFK